MRSLSAIIVLLALSACDRSSNSEPAAPAAAAEDVREVAAADGYGANGEIVNSVAFWSHPSVNFQGLVIASTPVGLKSFDIESGALISAARDTGETGEVEVFYAGAAPAQGYVIAAAGQGYVVRSIDNETRAFSPVNVEMGAPGAGGFCVGKRGDGLALYEIGDEALLLRVLDIREDGIAVGDPQVFAAAFSEGNKIIGCNVDDRTGDIIIVQPDGAIRRISQTGESFGLALIRDMIADSSAILASSSVADEPQQGGAIAILDGKAGVVRLVDLADGHALGMIRVKSTFDIEAIASAKAIALGAGNYGGVYRDGVIAVAAASDDQAPILLVPWNGVLAALQLPLGDNVDPRNPSPAAEDAPVIDIELIEP